MNKSVAAAISAFGASAKAKLANPAVSGAPEDQLHGLLEILIAGFGGRRGTAGGGHQVLSKVALSKSLK